jgi:hypothetical protein
MFRQARPRLLLAAAVVLLSSVATAFAFTSWSVNSSASPGVWGNIFNGIAKTGTSAWAVGVTASPAGNNPLAARWTGTTWAAVATPTPVANCQDGNPQWTGNRLKAVAGVSATDVWAVGHTCYANKTLVEHWNGTTWSIVPSPSFATGGDGIFNTLNGVAAVAAGNVWAVGSHTASNGAYLTLIERWNGIKWSVVPSPNPNGTVNILNAAAATGANDIWAVGYQNVGSGSQPLFEHWNGSAWSVVPGPARPGGSILSAVTAISATDVWAVGSQPASTGAPTTLVEHWNGSKWSVVPSPNLSTAYGSANVLSGVAAVSPTDVWAVGMFQNASTNYHQHRTLTLHWNGASWSVVTSPSPGHSGELTSIASLGGGKLAAGGYYSIYDINIYDGTYTAPRTLILGG